jgi:molybdate transport system substrate-binding protein
LSTAKQLERQFESDGIHAITLSAGSTGKLYAQIVNGAPFDVFLAADQNRPRQLEETAHGVSGSRFTYAVGRLSLWSKDRNRVSIDGIDTLRAADFRALAIANPALAPYGAAAEETLRALRVWQVLKPKIVMGESIGQAHAMVATGNAELGIIASSYIMGPSHRDGGSLWAVPAHLHGPIRQDVVMLRHGKDNPAAAAFMAFLRSETARQAISAFGYDVE